MGNQNSVLLVVLDLRIKARELKRQSDRCYRESLQEREKVRRALLRQNEEGARIFAQNYIRKQKEGLNCLHMSSKLEAVAFRLDGAHRSRQVNLENLLDVRSDSVSSLLDASTSSAMPARQVDSVLSAVAHEFMIPIEQVMEAAGATCEPHREQIPRSSHSKGYSNVYTVHGKAEDRGVARGARMHETGVRQILDCYKLH
ncbi:hypothetical protein Esti_000737 [Eimeria stiedai]